MTEEKKQDDQYFLAVWTRYFADSFGTGGRAELRRASDPEELRERPALYRLFPGERPDARHLRLAFMLPSCAGNRPGAPSFGTQLGTAKKTVAEARVLQMARSDWPEDIKQLRRLTTQIELVVDWGEFAKVLWYWNPNQKRRIVEDYYIAQFNPAKGAKK